MKNENFINSLNFFSVFSSSKIYGEMVGAGARAGAAQKWTGSATLQLCIRL
jgi:hypothetical protein